MVTPLGVVLDVCGLGLAEMVLHRCQSVGVVLKRVVVTNAHCSAPAPRPHRLMAAAAEAESGCRPAGWTRDDDEPSIIFAVVVGGGQDG